MTTELAVVQSGQLATRGSPMDALAVMSDQEFEQRLDSLKLAQKRMARIQRELMDADVDYGVIPGTGSKPTLLKPGAEKLCKFHHLVPTFEQETILGDGVSRPHIRIVTKCSLHYEAEDGPIVAQGMGAANSWEKKHRYREAQRRCPTCGAAAIYRSKYPDKNTGELGWYCFAKKGGCGATFGEQDPQIVDQQQGQVDNPDPYDSENTYVKISAKRAQTDATLRATATSGLFTQDLEDLEPEQTTRPAVTSKDPPARQAPRPETPTACSPAQVKAIYVIGRQECELSDDEIDEACRAAFGLPPSDLSKPQAMEFIDRLKVQAKRSSTTAARKKGLQPPTDKDVSDLSHFLKWAYDGGLKLADICGLLGVPNQIAIEPKYGKPFGMAAEVLLANVPEEGGETAK